MNGRSTGLIGFFKKPGRREEWGVFVSARFDIWGWLSVFFHLCAAAAMAVGTCVAAGLALGAGERADSFEEDSRGGQKDRRADGGAEHVFLPR